MTTPTMPSDATPPPSQPAAPRVFMPAGQAAAVAEPVAEPVVAAPQPQVVQPEAALPSPAMPVPAQPVVAQPAAPFSPEAAEQPKQAPKKRASLGRWIYRIVLWTVTALALAITLIPFFIERSGNKLITLTSGSMTPTYPVGATLVIDPTVDATALAPGQVITFVNSNKVTVTHRIVKPVTNESLQGVWYQTKGDANNAPDPDLTSAQAVLGVVEGPISWWQELAVQGQTPKGRLLVFGSLFLLVALGEGSDLVRSLRKRKEAES